MLTGSAASSPSGFETFEAARTRLTAWLAGSALPFWAGGGTDHLQGGFFERINPHDGMPVDEPRRARVVARQIYVFATALRRAWSEAADERLEHGLRFLLQSLRQPDGSFAASVRPDGTVVRGGFDLYEHAFILFSLAEAYRVKPDRACLAAVATQLLRSMRAGWGRAQGGFEENIPPTVPLLSNPHMHLFEAALAWEEVAPAEAKPTWSALADELAQLGLDRFIDPRGGALRENFDASWQPMPGDSGRVVEPGHQFEWAWLLLRWGALRGRDEAIAAAMRLVGIGETHGVDAARGVAVNELRDDCALVDPIAKLWPQTERIKAWCAVAGFTQDAARKAQALDRARLAAIGLARFFDGAPAGLWREQMDADGSLRSEPTRASSLYHIVCAIDVMHTVADAG